MAKRMLIDAAHPEEIRVAILSGNRLEEYDFEAAIKRQIKGNIYLAKVTRVEPSLQAAFVEYGGNRHGFLAFNEIHPDYYRIPVSDRAAFTYDESRRHDSDRGDHENGHDHRPEHPSDEEAGESAARPESPGDEHEIVAESIDQTDEVETFSDPEPRAEGLEQVIEESERSVVQAAHASESDRVIYETLTPDTSERDVADVAAAPFSEPERESPDGEGAPGIDPTPADDVSHSTESNFQDHHTDSPPVLDITGTSESGDPATADGPTPEELTNAAEPLETIGGGDEEEAEGEAEAPRPRFRSHRHYKIQEVIKRRQIMLVQVTKEERGNKGAALTTYLSLAGRYCVLMPNTPRGGGVSRKITSMQDRRRLKDLMSDLSVPEGMGVIVRTAGSERTKPEIKRDFEYLMRLWDEIRDLTLKSTAPALVYEEGNLIKRSIRDLYSRDIEEVVVDGDDSYRAAKTFMKMLMPSHAKRVKPYRDPTVPLFHRFQVESQIDAIHSPVVQLRSGGYIVINPTEALVAIDVNSGRATRERNIEETALKTNLEAAEEVARQLRLRDLAGLIVIDFIDMEESRNAFQVERRVKEAMRHDRARIQIGRISPFGLLELSRQRLRPSLLEASTEPCPHCGGTGHIRSTESTALHILRAVEEEGMRRRSAEISVTVPSNVALYLLNHKRDALTFTEKRYGFNVLIGRDETLVPPNFRLDRLRALTPEEIAALPTPAVAPLPVEDDDDDIVADDESEEALDTPAPQAAGMPLVFDQTDEDGEETSAEATAPAREDRDGERGGRGRRRHRRGRDGRDRPPRENRPREEDVAPSESTAPVGESGAIEAAEPAAAALPAEVEGQPQTPSPDGDAQGQPKRRRRGRRGGRRRRREHEGAEPGEAGSEAALASDGENGDGDGFEAFGESSDGDDTDIGAELPPATPEPMPTLPTEAHELPAETAPTEARQPALEPAPLAIPEPEPVSAPEPHYEPAPIVSTEKQPAPEPAPEATTLSPQPEPEPEPTGPPRHGWWRRR